MPLSKRLQAIYQLIHSPCVLADIGCDHALLPIAAVQHGLCDHAYACDIHQGPLNRAKEAVTSAGLHDVIQTVLSDGLEQLAADVSCVVIAGMGWESIISILSQNEQKAKQCTQLILQSNNHVDGLRHWLSENGYYIDEEVLVKERHYYQILSIHPGQQALSEDECLFGITLPKDPLFHEYLESLYKQKQRIVKQTSAQHDAHVEAATFLEKIKQKQKE